MASNEKIRLRVKRYLPERGEEPFYSEYDVPYSDDMVVLDALNYIKDNLDGSLSFRWSCRMGVCGSCGANVDGKPRLMCSRFLKESDGDSILVEPLSHFRTIKDLVVEIDIFVEKLRSIKPWIIRKEEKPLEEGEYLQTPQQRDLIKQTSMCINCMLCYEACPVFGMDNEFIGPAASAISYRYAMDSRDEAQKERLNIITTRNGVWDCTYIGECSVVCPKSVDPALAIQKSKAMGGISIIKSLIRKKK
ncbi:MAG: succinate dehydrogenase iron-sulfur subunit [Nitrososphaerales archaeon]